MSDFRVPYQAAETEFTEKRSRFIGHLLPVETEEQARDFIAQMKKKYYDARHNCWCYLIRDGAVRYSDDGEPASTAGAPILSVLTGGGYRQAMIAVVRYFGGTKLGVPGLIAAYRESAAAAIGAARIVERTVDRTVRVDFPYIVLNNIMRVVKEQQPKIVSQEFDNLCTMVFAIRESRAAELIEKLKKAGGSVPEEQ